MTMSLSACHFQKKQKKGNADGYKVLTISPLPTSKTLYFSGSILPVKTIPIVAPADGLITQLNFIYGQIVKEGQLLFVIKSIKQQSDYQDALTKYLTAKQTFTLSNKQLIGDESLYKQGLIPRNTYDSSKNTNSLNQLAMLQAEGQLRNALIGRKFADIENLSIDNIDAVNKALELDKHETSLNIYSPGAGQVLFPLDNSKKIQNGSAVKEGEVLLSIDPNGGISIDISIDEMNVNQLQVGQPAVITSIAFPNFKLNGYVKNIDAQASGSGNLPTFSATVIVPKLTPEQDKIIRIGMSAKIAITTQRKPQMLVPIYAVTQENGINSVKLLDPKTGKINKVTVETGETTLNDVAITSGLKAGDQVVLPN